MRKNAISQTIELNCKDLHANTSNYWKWDHQSAELYHKEGEPFHAYRLELKIGDFAAELQPSKGLSLGQALYNGKKIFWDAPYALPDPDQLDLWSDEVLINGKAIEGFTFLKTFTGGIELYGLKNWGMPRKDGPNNRILPIHGETSNIPVEKVKISAKPGSISVQGEFIYRDMAPTGKGSWYMRGKPLYRVTKQYSFYLKNGPEIVATDTIENLTEDNLVPDWGYHITFFPHQGSKLQVPSQTVEERSGGNLPGDIETWNMAGKNESRQETGIIHKGLKVKDGKCFVLLQHPDGDGILFKFPPAPYFQTWSCKGGAGSDEFKLKSGESLLKKNWDGLGFEIGSSALDHDGNIDKSVQYDPVLKPQQQLSIEMELKLTNTIKTMELASEINDYNKNRNDD